MRNFGNYRDLVFVLTQKEIKVRYKNHFLGYLWSIANPLAFTLVFYVAFVIVMRVKIPEYPYYDLFLVAGLFPWQWFSNSVSASAGSFIGNASIVKKVNFPRNVLPLATVLQDMFHFVLSIPVIVAFMAFYKQAPSISWFYGIPLLLAIHAAFTYGIALIVSSLNLFFRDVEKLVVILMMLLFYMTPIIYSGSMMPQKYGFWMKFFNPLAPLIMSWRKLFLDGVVVPRYIAASAVTSLIALGVGCLFYRKLSPRFAEVL